MGWDFCTQPPNQSLTPFYDIKKNLKAWIDVLMIYCKTEDQFIQVLNQFLTSCAQYGPKVFIKKAHFSTQQVRGCGGLIGGQGYETEPTNINSIRNMAAPQNVAERSEIIRCL